MERGNKRSKTEMLKIEQTLQDIQMNKYLKYYRFPREHMIDTNPRFGGKTNQKEKK
jgi:hypothetical protein